MGMKTTIVAANAATVTLTATDIPRISSDESIVEAAKRVAFAYGIAESGHRISRVAPTRLNPIGAVITLDRVERAA